MVGLRSRRRQSKSSSTKEVFTAVGAIAVATVGGVAAVVGMVCSSDSGAAAGTATVVVGGDSGCSGGSDGADNSSSCTAKPAEATMAVTVAVPARLVVAVVELG